MKRIIELCTKNQNANNQVDGEQQILDAIHDTAKQNPEGQENGMMSRIEADVVRIKLQGKGSGNKDKKG